MDEYSVENGGGNPIESMPPYVREFELMTRRHIEGGGIPAQDLGTVILNTIARLRLVMTADEVHAVVHVCLNSTEIALEEGTAFADPNTGKIEPALTAEQKLAMGMDRMDSSKIPDQIPEDWTE